MAGAVCRFCEGQGRVRVFVRSLRRQAFRPCKRCGGTGHDLPLGSSSEAKGDAA